MFKIKVPATTANLGPGFDSIGLAVNLFLEVTVENPQDTWEVENSQNLPSDAKNLIVQSILTADPNTPPRRLSVTNEIPLARGLGSSSSAIIAGIEIANQLGEHNWSVDKKLAIANQIEGHPDNVAPALIGGLVVAVASAPDCVFWSRHQLDNVALIAVIPTYELRTITAREVLPETFSYAQAVKNSGIANTLIAKLLKGDFEDAGNLMGMDGFHEPFRAKLVPELLKVRKLLVDKEGVYGTYLSGAGPTVMTLVNQTEQLMLTTFLKEHLTDARVVALKVEPNGMICI